MEKTINILELASELATSRLLEDWKDRPENLYVEEDYGDLRFNHEAQDLFNEYYSYYETIINNI